MSHMCADNKKIKVGLAKTIIHNGMKELTHSVGSPAMRVHIWSWFSLPF